ncbi:MAG TPA: hypothetical protein VGO48_10040 [Conexibacter sp.]|jgi:hypothetical protein|nr:hypothetical protein [Conexibacter sp.]
MYATARRNGTWELRESVSTPTGPRSRTLASFRTLTPDVIERARERATQPVDVAAVRHAAVRAGAPVAPSDADRAAGELLAALAHGRAPRASLRALLTDALGGGERRPEPSDSARAAAPWVAASARERSDALRDLLLLADHLPQRRTAAAARPAFPRIASGRA